MYINKRENHMFENVQDVVRVLDEATILASRAAEKYMHDELQGKDAYPCGFAWVNIREFNGKKIRANSWLGKALAEFGVRKSEYEKCFQVWNPGQVNCQNVDAKFAGAKVYADHLKKFGFSASAGERLD